MARLSDQELVDLKNRALSAYSSGARLARAEELLVDVIDELLELRSGGKPAVKINGTPVEGVPSAPQPQPEPAPAPVEAPEPAPEPEPEEPAEESTGEEPEPTHAPKHRGRKPIRR